LDLSKYLPNNGHIKFWDLAPHSSALMPAVAGTTQPPHGQSAAYKVKMPACYPYTDALEYRVEWTGGATATSSSPGMKPGGRPLPESAPPGCALLGSPSECSNDPLKDMSFNLAWPSAGTYTLTITPLKDKHGRVYDASTATPLTINVQ
jgi:hypothetical protein